MLKQLTISAFALVAASAFAGEDWSNFDYKAAKPGELMKFVSEHAYKTLGAGDAYTITKFVGNLPGNYKTAVLRGLAQSAVQAKMIKDENQMAANAMPPMGDRMAYDEGWKKDYSSLPMDDSRAMRMVALKPEQEVTYPQAIKILGAGQDIFDQGLIMNLFEMKSFTVSQIPTVWNEKALDAIVRQIQANAKWTEPYRLKYTSLTPRTPYMGWQSYR